MHRGDALPRRLHLGEQRDDALLSLRAVDPRALLPRLARQGRREYDLVRPALGILRGYGIIAYPLMREKGGRNRAAHVGFKGIPDLGGTLRGGRSIYVELKRPGKKSDPFQVAAQDMLERQGAVVLRDITNVEQLHAALRAALTLTQGGSR